MFDSWLPGYAESLEKLENRNSVSGMLRTKYNRYKRKVNGQSILEKIRTLGRVFKRMIREVRDQFYINHWSKMNELSKKFGAPLPQFMHNTTLQTFAAMKEFRAESIPVRITLIRAMDSRQFAGGSESCGWEKVAELGVKVYWAPGDHETMFRGQNLAVTAKLVDATLEEASLPPTHFDSPDHIPLAAALRGDE